MVTRFFRSIKLKVKVGCLKLAEEITWQPYEKNNSEVKIIQPDISKYDTRVIQ